MIDGAEIAAVVGRYVERYPHERERLRPLLRLMRAGAAMTSRTAYPGHLTCSALVVDGAGRMLRIWHNVFGKWLQPGGHTEPSDTTLLDAAVRELAEETGIMVDASALLHSDPIDIDVHNVPPNRDRGEPRHHHFDVRYAFTLPAASRVTLQWGEVSGFYWAPLHDITSPRIADKLRDLLTPAHGVTDPDAPR